MDLTTLLNWVGFTLAAALAFGAAGHALLNKSDPRSALGWVAICLTFPLAGPLLYLIFGFNRIQRRATRLRQEIASLPVAMPLILSEQTAQAAVPPELLLAPMQRLGQIGRNVLDQNLIGGNCVEPLINGQEAYPAMLDAIRAARRTVYLTTYIFDSDELGRQFIDALHQAMDRGVEVRVLIDGAGEKYSWPWASRLLRKQGVPTALFLPPHLFPPELRINMRTHRKLLIVDGSLGFTGGMNISQRNLTDTNVRRPIADIHFILRGPVVNQLQNVFIDDWLFTTQERLMPPAATSEPSGDCLCRAVVDGPDQAPDNLSALLAGVISAATTSIKIMTPYFVPPREIQSALRAARYRGVAVTVLLPEHNNLPFVHWASRHLLSDLLRTGVNICYQPDPFCHAKLLLVDGVYTHLGSANFDCRSLRLNFELTVEVLDRALARSLERWFNAATARSRPIALTELASRTLPIRMRDAFFWLFMPYL